MPRFKLRPKERAMTEEEAVELRIWFYGARTVPAKCQELGITPHTLYDCVFYRGAYSRRNGDADTTFYVEQSRDECTQSQS